MTDIDSANRDQIKAAISLGDIFLLFTANIKTLILTPFLIGSMVAVYVIFIAEPVFVSSTTILPLTRSIDGANLRGLASQFGISIPGTQTEDLLPAGDLYPELIRSRSIARSLLEKKYDTIEYGPQVPLLNILLHQFPEDINVDHEVLVNEATEILIEDVLSLTQSRASPAFNLTVSVFEPQLAQQLAYDVIDKLDERYRQYKTQRVKDKKIFIEGRITDVNNELESKEQKITKFQAGNRNFRDSPTLTLEYERMRRDIDVQTQIILTLKQQYELAKIEEVEEAAVTLILDPPRVPLKKTRPKRILSVLLSGIFGFGLALTSVFLKEYFARKPGSEKIKYTQAWATALHELRSLARLRGFKR